MLIGALVLSLLIHLFGGALWAHTREVVARIMHRLPEQQLREQQVATSDAIRLERRTIPRPAQVSRVRPAPQREARPQQPRAKPTAVVARASTEPQPTKVVKPAPSAAPEIAHRTVHAPPEVKKANAEPAYRSKAPLSAAPRRAATSAARDAALSAAELAQLNAQFAHTIAASHVDLATIQKQSEERPVAVRHYPLQFTGMQAELDRGEGYIEPITMGQRVGGMVWYYTHYTYMWPDGHLEDDDIPWPFRYPVQHDLFALHIHLIPLQLPPPGYHLTRPLKPFLAQFLARGGQG